MIPKNIYRSWKTQNFHPKIDKQMKKMLNLNPEYEQIIYTDEQVQDYVSSNYDAEINKAFNKLTVMTAKVDFWRYLILYKKGGIYLDIDSTINSKIATFLNDDDDALITAETNPELFVQWALFFREKHPLLERVIDNVVQNINEKKYQNDIVNTTGPGVFTNSLQQIYKAKYSETLKWSDVNIDFNKKFKIDNSLYSYRIYGIDFNKNLSFKYKNTSYLYQDSVHWKKEESMKDLIL